MAVVLIEGFLEHVVSVEQCLDADDLSVYRSLREIGRLGDPVHDHLVPQDALVVPAVPDLERIESGIGWQRSVGLERAAIGDGPNDACGSVMGRIDSGG